MNENIFILLGFLSVSFTSIWTTTIINGGDGEATVTVSYRDERCNPKSKTLAPRESLYEDATCQRNIIEAVHADGTSKIITTGGYNNKGEIIWFK